MIWNPNKECMSREQMRELQGKRLQKLVNYVYHNVPFYRNKMQAMDISPDDIRTIDDLKTGMELPGIVTNITAFGAFVDIGLKQNGLIHASQMGVKGMADPSKVLKLRQQVKVTVVSVDLERLRIGLRLIK